MFEMSYKTLFSDHFGYKNTKINLEQIRGTLTVQSTPDNSNLQGKWKKVRVIESSSYREFEENSREKGKKQFLLHSEYFNHI